MAVQETVSNATAGFFGSTAGILAGLLAVAVLWLGAEHALNVMDVHLPLRQLMFGRTWHALGLYARFIHAAGASYVPPKVRRYSRGVTSSVLTKA